MNEEFKVGDKVVRYNTIGSRDVIGTVVKITDKRKDVVVDYGNFKETYDQTGYEKGVSNWWYKSSIKLLTPEIEEKIRKEQIIIQCKKKLESTKLTYEQAKQILKILLDTTELEEI